MAKNAYNVPVQRIYFIDEAHRNYSPDGSFLKNLISSDTNAVKIALTGTPIISKEYNTKDIFGDYIHTYFYNASIADGYTRRLIREDIGSNYKIKLKEALNSIRVKVHSVKESDVYAHHVYVQPLLDYIIEDLRTFRQKNEDNTLGGMVVCNSKEQAQLMYRLFLEKYADESELDNRNGRGRFNRVQKYQCWRNGSQEKALQRKVAIVRHLSHTTVSTRKLVPSG